MRLELVRAHARPWNALVLAVDNAWRRLAVEEAGIGIGGRCARVALIAVVVFVLVVVLVLVLALVRSRRNRMERRLRPGSQMVRRCRQRTRKSVSIRSLSPSGFLP
jgi:hypothetical protein